MPLPAADLPAPIAVLVLAWDEATPAVRALVEATHAPALPVDSILVMVPQADAPTHLSAEEYLPLPADTYTAAEEVPQATGATEEPAAAPLASTEPAAADAVTATFAFAAPNAEPAPGPTLETFPKEITAPTRAAVRVLRLASHSLPQLAQRAGQPFPAPIWKDSAQTPAAPYLGAATLASAPPTASPALQFAAPSTQTPAREDKPAPIIAADLGPLKPAPATTAPPPAASEATSPASPPAPVYEPAEALPQATLETDLPLAEDEANELEEAPSHELFQEADFSPGPAQAGWPGALASLRQPALAPRAAPAPAGPASGPLPAPQEVVLESAPAPASPATGALQPAATHYPAPDLNYQVIQYARFAVPVALAEAEFTAIYAPAWPTWLAAQELRQRTGRPLVLHVAALAAGDEPAGTATGWMADLQRQALQRADLILTETPALAERLRRELGLPFATVQAVAAADAPAIAQALRAVRPK